MMGFLLQTHSFMRLGIHKLMDLCKSCVNYLWIIVMFLSAVCTFILTAPIHCRGSIGDQVMQRYLSKSVQMKKQTHLHLF